MTSNFIVVAGAVERALRWATGDNPRRLRAILVLGGVAFHRELNAQGRELVIASETSEPVFSQGSGFEFGHLQPTL